jgi:hypothetical protein
MHVRNLLAILVVIASLFAFSCSNPQTDAQNVIVNAPSAATTVTLQAEDATISGGSVASSYTGYSGTGYADMDGTSGSYVQFTVNATAAGSASLKIYYANGTGSSVTYNVLVNGSGSSKSFSSGAWTTWSSASRTVTLVSGSNTIKIQATAATTNGINFDRIEVTGSVSSSTSSTAVSSSAVVSSSSKAASSSSKASSSAAVSSSSKAASSSSKAASSSAAVSSTSTSVASGDITVSTASELTAAITSIAAGNTIWLKDGTYSYSASLIIAESNSGSSGSLKGVKALNKGKAIIDFSGQSVADSNRGVILAGSYWSFYGVVIQKAGDNGMLLAGHYNTIDNCTFYQNADAGCQISRYNTSYTSISQWPHNNTVSNCEAYDNYDSANGGENADGFAAKLTCGNSNKFTSCYSHGNSDDGWDLYTKTETGAIGVITFTSCTAEKNGYLYRTGKTTSNGDGNGFKLGDDAASVAHILTNCVANGNLGYGFEGNGNPATFVITNCTGSDNVKGLSNRMNGTM